MAKQKTIIELLDEACSWLESNSFINIDIEQRGGYSDANEARTALRTYLRDIAVWMPNPARNTEMRNLVEALDMAEWDKIRAVRLKLDAIRKLIDKTD